LTGKARFVKITLAVGPIENGGAQAAKVEKEPEMLKKKKKIKNQLTAEGIFDTMKKRPKRRRKIRRKGKAP